MMYVAWDVWAGREETGVNGGWRSGWGGGRKAEGFWGMATEKR